MNVLSRLSFLFGMALLLLSCAVSPAEAPPAAVDTCAGPAPPRAAEEPPRQVLQAHAQGVVTLEFGPDGLLATADWPEAGTIQIWDLQTGALLGSAHSTRAGGKGSNKRLTWLSGHRLRIHGTDAAITIDRTGQTVEVAPAQKQEPAFGVNDGTLWVNGGAGRFELALPANAPRVMRVAHNRDGSTVIAVLDRGDGVLIWRRGKPVALAANAFRWAKAVAVAEDGVHVAVEDDGALSLVALEEPVRTREVLALEPAGLGQGFGRSKHPIQSVSFSPDGSKLALTQGGSLRVWSVREERELAHFSAPRPPLAHVAERVTDGYTDAVFSPDGRRLVAPRTAGGLDVFDGGSLRRVRSLGQAVARPASLAFDGDNLIAAGDHFVALWSISTGQMLQRVPVAGVRAAWTAGGDVVVARGSLDASGLSKDDCAVILDRWNGTQAPDTYADILGDPRDTSLSARLLVLGGGGATVSRPTRKGWTPNGPSTANGPWCFEEDPFDYRRGMSLHGWGDEVELDDFERGVSTPIDWESPPEVQIWGPSLDPTGRYLFAVPGVMDPGVLLMVDTRTGKRPSAFTEGAGAWSGVKDYAIAADGAMVAIYDGKTIGALSVPDGKTVWRVEPPAAVGQMEFVGPNRLLVGLEDGVVLLVENGRIERSVPTAGGKIQAIELDARTNAVATVSADGSIRTWTVSPLEERIAMASFEDGEWISYAPTGAYTGSAEVADRLRWTFPKTGESFGYEQFASAYESADVIQRRARGEPTDVRTPIARPPSLEATLESIDPVASTARIRVKVQGATRVDHVRAFVDGAAVATEKVCASSAESSLEVRLSGGSSRVGLAAFDADGMTSNPAFVDVKIPSSSRAADVWIVAAGVSRYSGLDAFGQLDFADDDARAIVRSFQSLAGAGKPFANAHVAGELIDEEVSRESLERSLSKLSTMAPEDLAVVFLSGHGVQLPGGETALLTSPATGADAIAWSAIGERLQHAKGRVLVLLDTCHAGHMSRDRIVANAELAGRLASSGRSGIVVFAASKGRQQSLEVGSEGKAKGISRVKLGAGIPVDATAEGHGVFTGVLLRSLTEADTDRGGDGAVDIDELVHAVTERVDFITDGRQTPWVARREIFGSFTVLPQAGR